MYSLCSSIAPWALALASQIPIICNRACRYVVWRLRIIIPWDISVHSYHIVFPIIVSTWRATRLNTESCGTVAPVLVASFALLTVFRFCQFNFLSRVRCVVWSGLSLSCARVGETASRSMEPAFGTLSSSIVCASSACSRTLNTPYSPCVPRNILFYR